jgi:hypothetical protein
MRFALLLRLKPAVWPQWKDAIKEHEYSKIWFPVRGMKPSNLCQGIDVVVLATDGIGIVAHGKTSSGAEFCSDPDWKQIALSEQQAYKKKEFRICANLTKALLPLSLVLSQSCTKDLYKRRGVTWLSEDQNLTLNYLIAKHNKTE